MVSIATTFLLINEVWHIYVLIPFMGFGILSLFGIDRGPNFDAQIQWIERHESQKHGTHQGDGKDTKDRAHNVEPEPEFRGEAPGNGVAGSVIAVVGAG